MALHAITGVGLATARAVGILRCPAALLTAVSGVAVHVEAIVVALHRFAIVDRCAGRTNPSGDIHATALTTIGIVSVKVEGVRRA